MSPSTAASLMPFTIEESLKVPLVSCKRACQIETTITQEGHDVCLPSQVVRCC
jgi:hypothetical protein